MIVKNEERRLAICLESVRALIDEAIVVDTGSTDRTVEIATEYGAKVFGFDFGRTDFAAARNFGLDHATGGWILVLDADEALDPRSASLVRPCLGFGDEAGHYFERRNYSAQTALFTTDHVVRLFPNRTDFRYRGRIHETVDASIVQAAGRLQRTTGIYLNHFPLENEQQRGRKSEWYIRLMKEELEANPGDDRLLPFLMAEYHRQGRLDLAIDTAERMAQSHPKDPQAHLAVGIYRFLNHRGGGEGLVGARAALEEALRLYPEYHEALVFLRTLNETALCTGPL